MSQDKKAAKKLFVLDTNVVLHDPTVDRTTDGTGLVGEMTLAEVQSLDAGFSFDAFSDVHHRPDDELLYEVGRRSVTGNTDRFTLLFSKPAS